MKRVGFLLCTILAVALCGTAMAQDSDYYFVTYFSNNTSGAPDSTVRIINDGYQSTGVVNNSGTLYADFYVFNNDQELTECCACQVTADGILSESVQKNLTANPLTGVKPTNGVIKVVADACGNDTDPAPVPGLHGFATHIQSVTKTTYSITEAPFADANLSSDELETLALLCYFDSELSGEPCTCTPEGSDF